MVIKNLDMVFCNIFGSINFKKLVTKLKITLIASNQ